MRLRFRILRVLPNAAMLALLGVAGLGPAPQARAGALPNYDHVVVVMEENRSFRHVVGNPQMPYFDALMQRGALLINYHGVAHPSLPNYLALFSGSTQGVDDDGCNYQLQGANLYTELRAAGDSFATYSDGLPQAGFDSCRDGAYRKKHNPAAYWAKTPAQVNQPFSAFPEDYSQLPDVALVIPDQQHDMHDGSPAQADAWLKAHLAAYADWAKTHDSLLIVTWDEDDGTTKTNHIATVIAGAHVQRGAYRQKADHYNLLRTLEALFDLPPLGKSKHAAPIRKLWH